MNAEEKFPYWGVDGCKGGWFCVGLSDKGEYRHFIEQNIKCVVAKSKRHGAKIILIDIPIGLPSDAKGRRCDIDARKCIGKRKPGVFPVPCAQAMKAYDKKNDEWKEKAKEANRNTTKRSLSNQTLAIMPKIFEVNDFLANRKETNPIVREIHPEVCFRMLGGKELQHNKKSYEGIRERERILNAQFKKISNSNPFAEIRKNYTAGKVAKDDINDALVAAITASLGDQYGFKTLPKSPPTGENSLPMEMVYFEET